MQDPSHDDGIRPEQASDRYRERPSGNVNRLEVAFILQVEDALAFQDYHLARQSRATRSSLWWAIPVFSLLVGSLALFNILADPQRAETQTIITVVIAALVLGVYAFGYAFRRPMLRAATKRNLRRDRNFFMTHRVVLTPEAVENRMGPSTTRTLWEGVEKVVAKEKYLFIYLTKDRVIVIPGRAFDSEDDFEDFIDAARHYHRAARRRQVDE